MKRVIVHIGGLTLKGFRYEDRHAVAEGLRERLGQHFADPDAVRHVASRGDVLELNVGKLCISSDAKPYEVGAQAGRGIGKEMRK